MILFKKIVDLRKWLDNQKESSKPIGFVPTMGALHPGHISLIEQSVNIDPLTVCSIFINPTQFNDPKDFEKYPVTLEKDITMMEKAGCTILFLPSVNEMYPHGMSPTRQYDLGALETVLEGKFRPGHFQGVCRVVHRLLDIVQPGNLYLGQKDYQQCKVITRLIELVQPGKRIKVNICPTLREPDGLAMSSRNMRLQAEERKKAAAIYKSLSLLKENIQPGNLAALKQKAISLLEKEGFRADYVEIADAATLSPVSEWEGKQKLVALVAAYMNEVRLIDNMIIW